MNRAVHAVDRFLQKQSHQVQGRLSSPLSVAVSILPKQKLPGKGVILVTETDKHESYGLLRRSAGWPGNPGYGKAVVGISIV